MLNDERGEMREGAVEVRHTVTCPECGCEFRIPLDGRREQVCADFDCRARFSLVYDDSPPPTETADDLCSNCGNYCGHSATNRRSDTAAAREREDGDAEIDEALKLLKPIVAEWEPKDAPIAIYAKEIKALSTVLAALDRAADTRTQQQRWVSVEEGLPEPFTLTLVTVIRVSKPRIRFGCFWPEGHFEDGSWGWYYNNRKVEGKVIAWMPLPQPYRRGDEGGTVGD